MYFRLLMTKFRCLKCSFCVSEASLLTDSAPNKPAATLLPRIQRFAAVFCIVLLLSATVIAQSSVEPPKTFSLGVAPGGTQRHVPGRWATLSIGARNNTDVDAEQSVAVIVADQQNLQYARRLWVPAGALRRSWLPIQIPPDIPTDQLQLDITSMQLGESVDGDEQFQANEIGMPTVERTLLLSHEDSRCAVVFATPDYYIETESDKFNALTYTVNAGRDGVYDSRGGSGVIHWIDDFLPPSPVGLNSIDQLVIASGQLLRDSTAAAQLRKWVFEGGQLWIMTDQIPPEIVRQLIGDTTCYEIVDRVELNEFSITTVDNSGVSQRATIENWTSETPVELLRVVADTDDVVATIDGWPAAFRKPLGKGEVLFTTLGARGWTQGGQSLLIYQSIAKRFFSRRSPSPQPTADLLAFVDAEIGYEIPSRSVIASILLAHFLVIVGAGIWLAIRGKLQQMAWIIPVAGIASAAILMFIGNAKTSAIPSTVATSQIARPLPSSSDVDVHSVAAVYSSVSKPLKIQSSSDAMTMFRDGLEGGEVKRLMFTDFGKSQWQFVELPPGVVRHVETDATITLPKPWNVIGRFTRQGFEGRLDGIDASTCEDAVIITPSTPSLGMLPKPNAIGFFVGGVDNVLAEDQYISTSIVSDIQQDRQGLIRRMLDADTPPFGTEPTMLVWTNPLNLNVDFGDGFNHRGSTLASLPVQLQRLSSGSEFVVPETFVRFDTFAGTRGRTAIYNPRIGRWIELNQPADAQLKLIVPDVLLPCSVKRVNVQIKINAPSRTLTILGRESASGERATLFEKKNPTGVLRFSIDDPDALQITSDGGILLSVVVSESDEERESIQKPVESGTLASPSRSTWRIDHLHANVEGVTL